MSGVKIIRILSILLLTICVQTPAIGDPKDPSDNNKYDNTYAKDFIMDAPWRVVNEWTPIPVTIVIKDCDVDYLNQLHWIRCWDVTGGGSVLLWDHDFDDEELGDDPYEHNYWTYITTVTEGHSSLPDGTPLTPANLGYVAGDAIQLMVSIYYRDNLFNWTETRYLRVLVGHGAYPWPEDWYGGDTHYHTMYTNNTAEFGAPLPAVTRTARAMGLNWLTTTDHSCDLDETGDGSFSYATTHWEYTVQDESGTQTFYRDNTAIGSTWDVLGEEVSLFESPELRLFRGVELNMSSIDVDSYQKTLHCLIYNDGYIDSPLSGAVGERPVTPTLPDALGQITGDGFAYAAHPLSDLAAEWGGLDFGVNGATWGDEDIAMALLDDSFCGLEAFNTRSTRYSGDNNNPWPDFDSGTLPDDPFPNELLAGIEIWDQYLQAGLGDPTRKVFLAGGSDAHGDFNYSTYFSLGGYATDNAIGKVQTVVFVPDTASAGYNHSNLPPAGEIMAAYKAGRSVVTDGPFLEMKIDRNGDGDFLDSGDLMPGGEGEAYTGYSLPMTISWASTQDFGPVVSVEVVAGNAAGKSPILSLDPSAIGEGWSGEHLLDLGPHQLEGPYYFRAQCLTDSAQDSFRAYTNPIWIYFDPVSSVTGHRVTSRTLALSVSQNPFSQMTVVSADFAPHMPAEFTIYDVSGRLITTFDIGVSKTGRQQIAWDATTSGGVPVPSGVYFLKLEQGQKSITTKAVLLK